MIFFSFVFQNLFDHFAEGVCHEMITKIIRVATIRGGVVSQCFGEHFGTVDEVDVFISLRFCAVVVCFNERTAFFVVFYRIIFKRLISRPVVRARCHDDGDIGSQASEKLVARVMGIAEIIKIWRVVVIVVNEDAHV